MNISHILFKDRNIRTLGYSQSKDYGCIYKIYFKIIKIDYITLKFFIKKSFKTLKTASTYKNSLYHYLPKFLILSSVIKKRKTDNIQWHIILSKYDNISTYTSSFLCISFISRTKTLKGHYKQPASEAEFYFCFFADALKNCDIVFCFLTSTGFSS